MSRPVSNTELRRGFLGADLCHASKVDTTKATAQAEEELLFGEKEGNKGKRRRGRVRRSKPPAL